MQRLQSNDKVITYVYDNQGNTLEEQHKQSGDNTLSKTTYQYDSLNRNIKTVTRDGDVQENTYDPLGLRNEVKLNGKVSKYVFRGTEVSHELSEYDEVRNREVRGYGLLSKENGSVNVSNGSTSNGNKVYYYLHNDHTDVTGLVDEEYNLQNSYEYDAFGDITKENELVPNEFKYYEQQFDNATHLYYLRARYYDPTVGRFTQEDVYRGDGLNLYAYVKNNPIMWVDPSGYKGNCDSKNVNKNNLKLSSQEIELGWLPDKYTAVEVTGNVKVAKIDRDVSRRVYQIEIDPNYVAPKAEGRTNMQLMEIGNAPYIIVDGVPQIVELHHLTQVEPGRVVEIGEFKHDQYTKILHIDTSAGSSFRNNSIEEKQFNNFRRNYWKMRAFNMGGM